MSELDTNNDPLLEHPAPLEPNVVELAGGAEVKDKVDQVVPGVLDSKETAEEELYFEEIFRDLEHMSRIDEETGDALIGCNGVNSDDMERVALELTYKDGTKEVLSGKEIAYGGVWTIPKDKVRQLKGYSLVIK